jgi:transposase
MKTYFIGADVHCTNTELAVENNGNIVQRFSVPTTIKSISEVLNNISGKKLLTFEEGPMAGWLYRNLKDKVHEIIVCDPRRNKLIAFDGDKDDRIDSSKLAALLRGKFLRNVYHSDDEEKVELKRWVGLYHDRVVEATRYINRIRAQARLYGIRIPSKVICNLELRQIWLSSLENKELSGRLSVFWMGLDVATQQKDEAKRRMQILARKYDILKYWSELPGVGTVRSITLFAYLDIPWRFKSKSKLWKYCGVGLIRETSGKDNKGRDKPARLQLTWYANKRLKNVVIGAATSAIMSSGDNVFRKDYESFIKNGMTKSNARHAVARKMLTIMWGMWKSNSRFDSKLC